MKISVAIVEDNRSFREKLADYLNETPGFNCACTCDTAEEALKIIPRQTPDVVLMDLHLPRMSGVDCIRRLKELCPCARILVLTVYEDNDRIFGALKAGASGYLLKRADPTDILHAIREVREGGAPMSSQIASRVVESFRETVRDPIKDEKLSQREKEILQQLSKGYSNKEIAEHFSISITTVNTHLHHIYEKLHVRGRAEAILKFLG
jgi:DNA-binding NarL/FixJ family response regulator